MNNPFSLKNKTILVTGASSGIGKSIAIESSKMGASLIITGRNEERLEETYRQLEGENHLKIVADMTKYEDIETMVQKIPQIDGFSNNSGITQVVLIKHIKQSILENILSTNTIAPILLRICYEIN